ncbi:MAG: type toxin-antitoxin system VapC family toxin [Rhizobium sp.]|nr:type toxin-antitoxin system VapC family toxin [Rhizobium sp.]
MEGYLADTHFILWSWHEPKDLPARYAAILASDAPVYASIVSIWEISIKVGIGKLRTVDNVTEKLSQTGFIILPIEPHHAESVRHLPHHHRDPFDRMLIAQAMSENLQIMTADRNFPLYDITVA